MYCLVGDWFCVLVNVDAGVHSATGLLPSEQGPRAMWPRLARTPGFYDKLDWLADGRELWAQVGALQPTILTGLPLGRWAEPHKRTWCTRELGQDVPVITCMSRDKHSRAREAAPEEAVPVLIDDRNSLREKFESAGGVFIHYTGTESAMAQLHALEGTFVRAIR